MQVQIENEYTGSDFSEILYFDYEKTAGDVVARVLSDAGCSYEAEVNILFTGEEEIREINSETRNMDSVTDVLSFPMHEYDTPGDFDELDPDGFDDFDPETGNLLLGDIVLCIPRVKSQAEEYGHSTLREFAFLIAHSALHLIGYDHMDPEGEQEMQEKQKAALDGLGITSDAR